MTCETCEGNGAAPGTTPATCVTCRGQGRVQHVSQSVLGQFVRTGLCPTCEGAGQIIETPCETCEGAGRTIEDRTVALDIPAGIDDGQRIRIRGEGHSGALGGPPGDILVQVRVRQESGIQRDGNDLHVMADLTITQAALGTTVSVPGPEGEIEVELPAGTQPGEVRVLRGRGMPALQSSRRGDFNVHVRVLVPRSLTTEQRRLVDQLGAELGEAAYREEDEGLFGRLKSAFR